MANTERLVTPIGEINWVFINGTTKQDLNGKDRYQAEIRYQKDSAEFKELQAKVDAFWEANKPKGAKMKSNGIRAVMDKNPETGDWDVETDFMSLTMWTGPHWPDGKDKIIKIYNAKGAEVSLGSKKIGNGTRGALSGVMSIYDNGPAARGVTIYLNAIQITRFVEYTDGDAGFAATEGDFEGANDDGFSGVNDTEEAKPRL